MHRIFHMTLFIWHLQASSDKKQLDVGANLFIGNLDENVDERLLYDTFSAFGTMATTAKVRRMSAHLMPPLTVSLHPNHLLFDLFMTCFCCLIPPAAPCHCKHSDCDCDCDTPRQIARDPQSGKSKGYGFVSYTDFESSDAAIESMNGQFLMNKAITVQYAFKKDGKGERHGTPAERLLAAQARKNNALPVAARPPPAPMGAFGARPPMPGYPQGPYQGQFAGALAAAPPPPAGFTPQQTIVPQGMPQGMPMPPPPMQGMPPQGMMGVPPPPPPGVPVYNPQAGFAPPPPPPGYVPQGMPGMMPPPMMGPPGGMPPPQYMPPPQQM